MDKLVGLLRTQSCIIHPAAPQLLLGRTTIIIIPRFMPRWTMIIKSSVLLAHMTVLLSSTSRVPSFRKEKRDKKAFHMQSELPQLLPNTRVGRELEAVNEVTQLFNGPSTAGTQKAFCTYCCAAAAVVLLRRRLGRLRDDDALSCFCCYQRTSFLIFWIGNFSVIHEWSGKKPESRSD